MIDRYIDFKKQIKKPDISELLLRKIIQLGQSVFRKQLNEIKLNFPTTAMPNVILREIYY